MVVVIINGVVGGFCHFRYHVAMGPLKNDVFDKNHKNQKHRKHESTGNMKTPTESRK